MEYLALVLAILLILGAFSISSDKLQEITDPRYRLLVQGAIFIKKRIILISLLIIALLFIALGYDYIQKIKQKYVLLEAENKRIKERKEREITLSKLLEIIKLEQHEKETKILSFDFDVTKRIDEGPVYDRDSGLEEIENWDTGTLRYITIDKTNYVRIKNSLDSLGFKFQESIKNNMGDPFNIYMKDNIRVQAGVFSDSKEYLIILKDITRSYAPKAFIEDEELVGTWGRVGKEILGSSGTYTIREDGTFKFLESEEGPISGKWKIAQREITFYYNSARDARFSSNSPHKLSNKAEVIVIESKLQNELSGYIKGVNRFSNQVLLRRK